MHKLDCLPHVITVQEAAGIWQLSRNTLSSACARGALRGRKSGGTWLVTIADVLRYQGGRFWPGGVPVELRPAFERAAGRAIDWAADWREVVT